MVQVKLSIMVLIGKILLKKGIIGMTFITPKSNYPQNPNLQWLMDWNFLNGLGYKTGVPKNGLMTIGTLLMIKAWRDK